MEDIKNVDETAEKEPKTYTQEEYEKALQAESDRRTTKALQTAKEKWEEEYQAKLETEKSEAEKLASMTQEEKWQAKLNKEKEEFENERKKFLKEKMELETVKLLSSEGLPVNFASYVLAEDAESVKENINLFKQEWQSAIEQAVNERLKGNTPKTSITSLNGKTITRAEFDKLSYKEKEKMVLKDPDLLKKMK